MRVDLYLVDSCQHPQRRQKRPKMLLVMGVTILRMSFKLYLPGQGMNHPLIRQNNWKTTSSVLLFSLTGWTLLGSLAAVRNLQKRMQLLQLYCGWRGRHIRIPEILTTSRCFWRRARPQIKTESQFVVVNGIRVVIEN